MGRLVEGRWHSGPVDDDTSDGRFDRQPMTIRDAITADGSSGFRAEAGRYHLYVSYACPWAHRTLIGRKLKGLEDKIGVSVVHPKMLDDGWTFETDFPGATGDPLLGKDYLYEVYQAARPDFSGKVTVPVLWDTKRETIVNNESSEILRMLDSEFDAVGATGPQLYPEPLRDEIDEVNERVYHTVNNGVYKAGFAQTQAAYEEAVGELFDSLDWLEARLEGREFLVGDQLTEADIRLFTTLVRFDPVYATHFKCNVRRLVDYDRLWRYAKRLYHWPGVAETVHFDHIKTHYYYSHETLNPKRIIAVGFDVDWGQSSSSSSG